MKLSVVEDDTVDVAEARGHRAAVNYGESMLKARWVQWAGRGTPGGGGHGMKEGVVDNDDNEARVLLSRMGGAA